jgi:hypothetical protein
MHFFQWYRIYHLIYRFEEIDYEIPSFYQEQSWFYSPGYGKQVSFALKTGCCIAK